MKKLYFLSSIIALAFVVVACTPQQQEEVADVMMEETDEVMHDDSMQGDTMLKEDAMKAGEVKDDTAMMEDDFMEDNTAPIKFEYSGALADVSGGNADGVARAVFVDNLYILSAAFNNLPQPNGTDFYEGWVVRKNPLNVISTGPVTMIEGGGRAINSFTSFDDLTSNLFYVLTLEPDDGDPAPAAHILEGTMVKITN